MVPKPQATPAQWAELAVAAERLAAVAQRIEDASGDGDVREIRRGASAVHQLAADRAYEEAPESAV